MSNGETEAERDLFADAALFAYDSYLSRYSVAPRVVAGTTPSAGADWSVNVAGLQTNNVVWIPVVVTAQLVTSVAVANRAAKLSATISSVAIQIAPSPGNEVASLTQTYTWARGMVTNTNSQMFTAIPQMMLPPGSSIGSSTANLQAADQWQAISVYVLEIAQKTPGQLASAYRHLLEGDPVFEQTPGAHLGL